MYHSIQLTTSRTLPPRNCKSRSPLWHGLLLPALALCFTLSPTARAVNPAPDGDYPKSNTAEGNSALFSLTTGFGNTAIGFEALFRNTTGGYNTATGLEALYSNTTGNDNTANGNNALYRNTTGSYNTANGDSALGTNTTGSNNTATGFEALESNTTGNYNTATGFGALFTNSTGYNNTASGIFALYSNTTGVDNTASGRSALSSNTIGSDNTVEGINALSGNTTGSLNIALGSNAGANLTTGSNNIDIGAAGVAGESGRIRIGKSGTQSATYVAGIYGKTVASGTRVGVMIDSTGKLGTVVSSARFKEAIKPMDKASEALLQLQPVTFRYKQELDPDGVLQFGLVAEQVEKVSPDLVIRDEDGKVNTVRYEAVNAMLLNEFLKEHRKVEEQQATISQLKSTAAKQESAISQLKSTVVKQEAAVAQQQKDSRMTAAQQQGEIQALIARLNAQQSQIRKVSEQVEMSKPASQVVVNNQ